MESVFRNLQSAPRISLPARTVGPLLLAALWLLPLALPAEAVARRVFVTSVMGTGNLASWPQADPGTLGVAAGNSICQNLAEEAGLSTPQNPKEFRAWLSDSFDDAACLVRGQSGELGSCVGPNPDSLGPFYLSNGITQFSASLGDLIGQKREIYRGALMDEHHDVIPSDLDAYYWTGTEPDGQGSPFYCDGWTSAGAAKFGTTGIAQGTARFWTNAYTAYCSSPRRLLCLEVGAGTLSKLRWSPGQIAFVTSTTTNGDIRNQLPGSGLSGLEVADRICQSSAANAGLPIPDSFRALLSTPNVDAVTRLAGPGPFRRLDGYLLANTVPGLLNGAIGNSIHVDEFGHYLHDQVAVWTGSWYDGTYTGDGCGGWASSSSSGIGGIGWAARSRDPTWLWAGEFTCEKQGRLYCVSSQVTLFWDGFETTGDTSLWSNTVP